MQHFSPFPSGPFPKQRRTWERLWEAVRNQGTSWRLGSNRQYDLMCGMSRLRSTGSPSHLREGRGAGFGAADGHPGRMRGAACMPAGPAPQTPQTPQTSSPRPPHLWYSFWRKGLATFFSGPGMLRPAAQPSMLCATWRVVGQTRVGGAAPHPAERATSSSHFSLTEPRLLNCASRPESPGQSRAFFCSAASPSSAARSARWPQGPPAPGPEQRGNGPKRGRGSAAGASWPRRACAAGRAPRPPLGKRGNLCLLPSASPNAYTHDCQAPLTQLVVPRHGCNQRHPCRGKIVHS